MNFPDMHDMIVRVEKEYILKHKDIPVLLFTIDDETYKLLSILDVFNKEHCPFANLDNNVIQQGIALNKWLSGRGLAQSRKDLAKIKKLFNAQNTDELTIKTLGLSLTDHYWFHNTSDNILWKNVNYFDNTFDKVIPGKYANPDINDSVNQQSPNLCVDGSIEKRWIIKNGERVLLKGSFHTRMQEPFNEKIVSEILKLYNIDHVEYNQYRTEDKNIPYSECKCMINRDIEFINAKYIFDGKNDIRKDFYEYYIAQCRENNIPDAKERLDEMLAIDFLIGNDDRHKGNFGILRDANSLKWIKIAPLFDNGNCLFFDQDNDSMQYWGVDSIGKSFEDSNRLNLEKIDYPQWYKSNLKVDITDIIRNELKNNERLLSERIEKICEITNERYKVFEKCIAK